MNHTDVAEKANYAVAAALRQQGGALAGYRSNNIQGLDAPPPPDRIQDTVSNLAQTMLELADIQRATRDKLIGSQPSPPCEANIGKSPYDPGLSMTLAIILEDARQILSDAHLINSRL